MAEERNHTVSGGGVGDTGEIREEIARTRSEMSETIGAIQGRLTPEHLIQQAKESVQEAAAGKMRSIMHSASDAAGAVAGTSRRTANQATGYVKDHPVQLALVATGVTWWLTRNSRPQWQSTSAYDAANDRRPVREAADGYATQAKHKAREVGEQVRDVASTATEQVQQGWQQAGNTTERWLTENPLAVGVAAIAAGIAIGLAVPRSQFENRTFGDTRDSVVEMAGEAARDLRDSVTNKAKDVAQEVIGAQPASQSTASPGTATSPTGANRMS